MLAYEVINRYISAGVEHTIVETDSQNAAEDICSNFRQQWGWGYSPSTNVYPTQSGVWRVSLSRWTSCE